MHRTDAIGVFGPDLERPQQRVADACAGNVRYHNHHGRRLGAKAVTKIGGFFDQHPPATDKRAICPGVRRCAGMPAPLEKSIANIDQQDFGRAHIRRFYVSPN